MIFHICGVPGCGATLGSVDDGDFNIRISHGLCRYHFLKQIVEEGLANEEEKRLLDILDKARNKGGSDGGKN